MPRPQQLTSECSMSDGKSPTHRVYTLVERKDADGELDTFWLNIGSAWPNKDAKGFNLTLQALPLDGKLVLREIKEEPPEPKGKGSRK